MSLIIYSGKVPMGLIGTPADLKTSIGEQLFVGDIVITYKNYDRNTLAAVVADNECHFVMGIKSLCKDPWYEGWTVLRVKKFSDVISGEKWPEWGFNYQEIEA